LKLRVVPKLYFHWDKSLETGDRISRLIDQIEGADARLIDQIEGADARQSDAAARSL
jgi:hypothetical protein